MLAICTVLVALVIVIDSELAKQRTARGVIEQHKRDRGERRS